MEKEMNDFLEKLREERSNTAKQLRFVSDHKFEKEADFLRDRIKVIGVILSELERVVEKRGKGINAEFSF